MAIGDVFSSPAVSFCDRETGARITRLTSGRYNSCHLYFTNNPFFDGGRKMVICSDLGDGQNYFVYDFAAETLTQLTDLPRLPFPETHRLYEGIVDGIGNRLYFFAGDDLIAVDLLTYAQKVLYTKPEGWLHHVVSTRDGSPYVFTSIIDGRAMPDQPFAYKTPGYSLPHPESRILRIAADGSGFEEIYREREWIAHVNVSPTSDEKITFCHEGPWHLVDHRIFGLDTKTGKVWKIADLPGCRIGHEYWYADGCRIGFHGSGKTPLIGCVSFENEGLSAFAFDYHNNHTYSLDERLIAGDGIGGKTPYLSLWKLEENGYSAPYALCRHDCTFKTQSAHVHPRFFPDGKKILYTSDAGGYEQIYTVDLPEEIGSLPLLSELLATQAAASV